MITFDIKKLIEKGIKGFLKGYITAFAGIKVVESTLTSANITEEQLLSLIAGAALAVFDMLRNWLKIKFPKIFGWL